MRFHVLFSVIVVLSAVSGYCSDEKQTEYYALLMDGQKIGHVVHIRKASGGQVETTETTKMSLGRAGVTINITTIEKSIETADGKPIAFESTQDMGAMKAVTSGRFLPSGKIEITKKQMGSSSKTIIDYDSEALLAEGLRLMQVSRGLEKGTSYKAKVFVPSMVKAVDAEVNVGGKEEVDLFGRVVSLSQVNVRMSTMGGAIETTGYVDDDFRALKAVTPAMGMDLVMVACDKEFAMSTDDEVDFLDRMMVQSPAPLKTEGRKVQGRVTYTLVPKHGSKLNVPGCDNQKVTKLKGGKLQVTVDPVKTPKKCTYPYAGTDTLILDELKPSEYLQSDNKKIIDLAKRATRGIKDAGKAAHKIEKFVGSYITEKNLSVGYATALEVAESRTGDCSEHSVLTAAMCRASGIPARVVCGLVYAEEFSGRRNLFAGHAWVQAYVGDKWIGLDAIMPYGAGHIALASGNGDPDEFFSMVNTFGFFTIEKIQQ